MNPEDASIAERLARLEAAGFQEALRGFSHELVRRTGRDWRFWARPNQLAPEGDWFCWLVIAGRGFGKTRLGAEWVRQQIEGPSPLIAPAPSCARVALVAHSFADGREVMIEGESGFMSCARPDHRPIYEATRHRLIWPNGAQATLYSAEEPGQLRGPQHDIAWADEFAKWRQAGDVWSNLVLGLRLGERPRVTITTTPRPMNILREIMNDSRTVVTRGSTFANRSNLPPAFLAEIKRRYRGTRIGRQEIDGEILDEVEGALWTLEVIDKARVATPPQLERIVVAVDPPVTSGAEADACGIIAAGRSGDRHFYVLADRTIARASPDRWAREAIALMKKTEADRLVAEVNNGGDLVEAVLRAIDPTVPYRAVRASRGKIARAEPVAALYERGLVHHCGAFEELEDQLTSYVQGGGMPSPDRLDALVWALTELSGLAAARPQIRSFS